MRYEERGIVSLSLSRYPPPLCIKHKENAVATSVGLIRLNLNKRPTTAEELGKTHPKVYSSNSATMPARRRAITHRCCCCTLQHHQQMPAIIKLGRQALFAKRQTIHEATTASLCSPAPPRFGRPSRRRKKCLVCVARAQAVARMVPVFNLKKRDAFRRADSVGTAQ